MPTEFRLMKQVHPPTDKPWSVNRAEDRGLLGEAVTWLGIDYATKFDAMVAREHEEVKLMEKFKKNSSYGKYDHTTDSFAYAQRAGRFYREF